ncbi:MAG: NAD(P)/FAD-dependent oxidoreductase, partial [Desulfobacterales bacterium]|nr:NAD(P)/FAD-dependent oxidoreductase [Desulfobacterales bacterium]
TSSGRYRSRAVIVAGGARHRSLGVPGEKELFGKGIFHCAMCDGGPFAEQEVAIVGGGEGGVTEGLYMTRIASKVTVIEIMPQLSAPAIVQERARTNPKLEIMLSTQVVSISESDGVRTLRLRNTETGKESELRVSGIFVIIGLEPAIEYLHGLVDVDGAGFIKVDHAMKTSLPGIFAAGDVRSGSIWQAIAAAGDGAVAARSAEKYLSGLAK